MNTTNLKTATRLLAAAMALALLGACASTRTQEGTGEYVDDTVVTTKVKAAILGEPTLKSAEINVETFKGRVQLSGFVSSRPEMETAVKVARNVKGVSGVANDMRLK
jgi:osmotically-inducible protein OsmY